MNMDNIPESAAKIYEKNAMYRKYVDALSAFSPHARKHTHYLKQNDVLFRTPSFPGG
jgi:hypothetical protein